MHGKASLQNPYQIQKRGSDKIYDYEQGDTIIINGVSQSTISIGNANTTDGGSFLRIQYSNNDAVFIKNGISLQDQLNIQLDDGKLDVATLLAQSLEYTGSNSADTITLAEITAASAAFLGAGDDIGIGNSFANQLYGEDGKDRLQGRKGQDVLVGGQDEDTFIFEVGDTNENITRLAA